MADSNHPNARTEDLIDEDPFAELQRIMGQGSVVTPRAVDDETQSFGLDLDLEKELLGDFGAQSGATSSYSPVSEPQFGSTDAFGNKGSDSDLFRGTGLEEFERLLKSDPVFAREETQAFEPAVSADELADTLDSALSEADWGLSSAKADPVFGGSNFASGDTKHDPFSLEQEAPAAAPAVEHTDLSHSVFASRQDANVLSPRVDDFYSASQQADDQLESHEFERSLDRLLDEEDLQSDHATEPSVEADPFEAALSSDIFAEAFEEAAQESQPAVAEHSIEDELENVFKFDWGHQEQHTQPVEPQAWAEPQVAEHEASAEPEWQTSPAEEKDWAVELSDDFSTKQASQVDASRIDNQENWNEPAAATQDWNFDPASLRQAASSVSPAPEVAYDYQQAPAHPDEELDWSQQADSHQWSNDPADSYDDGAPEIETVEIPEKAVAITEDLDLPHVPYHEEVKPAAPLDDIEDLLSGAFGNLDQAVRGDDDDWGKAEASQPEQAAEADSSEFDDFFTADLAAASAAALARNGYGQAQQVGNDWDEPLAYEKAPRPMPGTPPPAAASGGFFSRRGMQIAALLAGVAIIGGGGVLAYNYLGDGSGETVLIKADNSSIKEKPENPGGATIPNQDSQVYRQVAGETGNSATESQLISAAEEPVDLPSPNDDAGDDIGQLVGEEGEEFSRELAANEAATGPGLADTDGATKNEERLVSNDEQEQAASSGFPTVAPRKVRSFIVRPDGTMVPREVETPAVGNAEALPGVPNDRIEVAARTSEPEEEGLVPGQEVPSLNAASAAPANESTRTEAAASGEVSSMPASAPIPAPRPASAPRTAAAPQAQAPAEPVQAAPTQVAAAQPAAPQATAASSGWSVQIASQPSLEAAQQSYQSMAQRYGTMLQGKGVNIVKAEVPGKGTYYRVRIPASSKNDAVALCERLKSQGGTCFVSQ